MTYTETQLEAIRLFGKKDLTKGNICLMNNKNKLFPDAEDTLLTFFGFVDGEYFFIDEHLNQYSRYTENFEILGHIPHLEDLFRVAEEKGKVVEVRNVCYSRIELFTKDNPFPLCVPYNPTLPLLEQSEETLNQICNLFK